MNTRSNLLLLRILTVLSFFATGEAIEAKSDDSYCQSTAYAKEPVCDVSYYQLIISPEKYDGKLIRVVAVLKKFRDGSALLFPSKESEYANNYREAIILGDSSDKVRASIKDATNVRIIGRFAKGPLQFDTAVFGAGKIDPVIDIGTIEFDVSK